MNWTSLEIGVGLLILWIGLIPFLWKSIEREGRPGWIRGNLVVEHVLLAHMFMLVLGVSFVIKGSGLFN